MSDKLSKLSWLEELYALSRTAAAATDLDEALVAMLKHIAEGFAAGSGTLALMVDAEQVLEIVAGTDLPADAIGQKVQIGRGVLGGVALEGKPVLINGQLDISKTSRPAAVSKRKIPTSSMCWPLHVKGKLIGVMSMNRFEVHAPFEERDLQRGSIMVNMLALVIENLRMHIDQQHRIERLSQLNRELEETNRRLAQTQAQLVQSEKMASIGQLAAGVAHEINNPIGYVAANVRALESYAKELLQRLRDAGPLDGSLRDIEEDLPGLAGETREGLERVRSIVQNLRDFSSVDVQEQWEQVDLNAWVRSAIELAQPELSARAELQCTLTPLPPVSGLPAQLQQVFRHLLVNAAQALRERGHVAVTTGREDQRVWVEVRDDGEGMPPEVLRRIFEPFFTTRPVGSGTGLGLSLAYSIVQKHQGTIDVHSEAGKGSRFRVWLPMHRCAA
ncbi:ATP-binding protein [Schlegelella sp. S2-27]|uniref:histidine kinase n=1 Tax=Caldimonas mangrovi TaxID=2944811 RepID=A0ABT0YJN9_9BURK|nr:ATP-binding protein [Caldimonas mangrovi]MCM5678614.1 ATP-binding protein [Caldimonas mangrovi]